VEELVAVEAGDFLFLEGFLLVAGFAAVGGEQILNDFDFLGGLEAGEAVGLGAEDEGIAALEEDGAAGIEAGADDIAVGGEIGGSVAIFIEHLRKRQSRLTSIRTNPSGGARGCGAEIVAGVVGASLRVYQSGRLGPMSIKFFSI
jgi:hypothetical protein